VRSRQWGGAWIDLGAEFFADADLVHMNAPIDDLGMRGELITYPGEKVAFEVWRNGTAHPLSFTEPTSFLRFGAMTLGSRLQLVRLLPLMIGQLRRNKNVLYEPWRAAWCDDESVEDYLNRICPEMLEYAIEPCFELYCGYEPHDFGKAMFAYLMTSYRQTSVVTFKEGLGQFTRALGARLKVVTKAHVRRVAAEERSIRVEVEIDGHTEHHEADFVIIAVPGTKVLGILPDLDAARRAFFENVRYTPHELPFFKLSRPPEAVPKRVFYPRKEDPNIAALGYDISSTDPNVRHLRVSMKTGHIRRMLDKTDAEDLEAILIEAEKRYPQVRPLVEEGFVSRWRDALPLFWPGYCRALEQFVALPPLAGIEFAGDYLAGPSTGAAYVTGQRAAQRALKRLS
jgi:oxygen-dependent protoporphyrinogen oxidase